MSLPRAISIPLVLAALLGASGCTISDIPPVPPLIEAAQEGDVVKCESLLDGGADVSVREAYTERTALMWAAWRGHPKVVDLLIRRGADVHAKDLDGYTPLIHAVCQPEAEPVAALLDAGSSLESVPGQERWTPLMFAVWNRQSYNVELLVKRGANMSARSSRSDTPLAIAKYARFPEIIQLLTELGATE